MKIKALVKLYVKGFDDTSVEMTLATYRVHQ